MAPQKTHAMSLVSYRNLRHLRLNERSRTQRLHIVQSHLDVMSQRGKFIEKESRLVIAWGWKGK